MTDPMKPGESPEEIAAALMQNAIHADCSHYVIDCVAECVACMTPFVAAALRSYGDRRGEEERVAHEEAEREWREWCKRRDDAIGACIRSLDEKDAAIEKLKAQVAEERAKALEEAALECEGSAVVGDSLLRDIARRIRSLAAAPSGDAKCDCCGRGPDECPMVAGASATCAAGDCACFKRPAPSGDAIGVAAPGKLLSGAVDLLRDVKCCNPEYPLSDCVMLRRIHKWLREYDHEYDAAPSGTVPAVDGTTSDNTAICNLVTDRCAGFQPHPIAMWADEYCVAPVYDAKPGESARPRFCGRPRSEHREAPAAIRPALPKRTPVEGMYPPSWPKCACGDYCLDGKATCGRVECL